MNGEGTIENGMAMRPTSPVVSVSRATSSSRSSSGSTSSGHSSKSGTYHIGGVPQDSEKKKLSVVSQASSTNKPESEVHRWDRLIPAKSERKKTSLTSPAISISGANPSVTSVDPLMYVVDFDPDQISALHKNANLEVFPSIEDLSHKSSEIFDMIKAKDYEGVTNVLTERGHKVDIIPKIGCSQLHYSRFNVANSEKEDGETPLIAAAKVSYKMVDLILRYGGNPNAINVDRDSPLSIAAVRGDRDSIDALLNAGANLNAAVIKLTSFLRYQTEDDQMHSGFESGFSVKSLTFLLSNDVYLKCRDPFRAAFDVSKSIEAIVNIRDEFRMEFELLIRDADVFAYRMLDQCDRMWEAREVLSTEHGLLRKAIEEKKKRFVGHPFSQQIILEEWYGKVAYKLTFGKIRIALKYIMSPVLLPYYLLKYLIFEQHVKVSVMESSGVDHMKLLSTPIMCFVTDVMNYFILLGLLIATCFSPKDSSTMLNVEIALWACTVSRLLIEGDQMYQQGIWRYLPNMWNVLELFSCLMITVAAIYRIIIWKTYDNPTNDFTMMKELHQDIMNVTYLYAITEFLIIIRWLNFLEFFPGLGPLLIALRTLIADVFKFVLIVLLTSVVGTAIAVHAIVSTVDLHNKKLIAASYRTHVKEIPTFFSDFGNCFINVIWSTFGLLEVPEIKVENDSTSTVVIYVILLLYIILAVVLMLNMLIALLNNTFERIQGNCDIEWKYARSELLKEYRNGQPFIFPFHFLLIPWTLWYRAETQREIRVKRVTTSNLEGYTDRDQLFCTLCDRYSRTQTANDLYEMSMNATMMNEGISERRDTFAAAVAIQRHNSFMRGARTKKKTSDAVCVTSTRADSLDTNATASATNI